MSKDTEQHGFGYIQSEYDVRDYKLIYSAINVSELPEEFVYDVLHIKNQGSSNTCAAHVMSEIVEFHDFKDKNKFTQFSTEFVYGFRRIDSVIDYVGKGMYLRDALKIIQKYGDVTYTVLPGNHEYEEAMEIVKKDVDRLKPLAYDNRVTSYYRISSIDELKYALVNHGPVVIGMKWYSNMSVSFDGTISYMKSGTPNGHAVMIIGYNNKGFVVQNSWGTNWGQKGTFIIPYEDYSKLVSEAYGVTDDIHSTVHPIENKKWLSDLINVIVRFFSSLFRPKLN